MVLSKPDILRYLGEGRLRIEPPVSPDQVAQVSIDLHLGRKFTQPKKPPEYLPAINVHGSMWKSSDLWEHSEQDVFRLKPGEFVLAQTLERIRIPEDLVGFVEGRSSWARAGITIHVTAPKIDPGFDGKVTLEMVNFGRISVDLRAESDQPAQLMLMQLTTPLKEGALYGSDDRDTFQFQTDPIPYRPKES